MEAPKDRAQHAPSSLPVPQRLGGHEAWSASAEQELGPWCAPLQNPSQPARGSRCVRP